MPFIQSFIGNRVVVGNGNVVTGDNIVMINGRVVSGGASSEAVKGDGKATDEHRGLTDTFTSVRASGIDHLDIVCGHRNDGVDLNADSNILPLLETKVEDGVLQIQPKDGTAFSSITPIRVKLNMCVIKALKMSGQVNGTLKEVDANDLKVKLSGASTLVADGTAASLDLVGSGACHIDCRALAANHARITVSGANQTYVNPKEELEIDASGACQVYYVGSPAITKDLSGACSVQKLG